MFKYFWISVLVFLVLAFVAYTAYAIKDFSENYKADNFVDWLETFASEHDIICGLWIMIIAATLIILFLASMATFFAPEATGG